MPKMSTGDAIFADLPTVPNIGSTGASLFGMSDESAKVKFLQKYNILINSRGGQVT